MSLFEQDFFDVKSSAVSPLPITVENASHKGGFYRTLGKRALDLTLVVLSAPIWMAIIAIAACIVARDGHNPFYVQKRVGRNGRIFSMIKLRSMVPNADAKLAAYLQENEDAHAEWARSQKLKNDPRITQVGRIIRKTSVDELPQLINVIKGDMSLVGPRPFMVNQRDLYMGESYYDMAPGLTGFWQVSERNECTFAERVTFDDDYHAKLSFKTDLSVLVGTVAVVARGTGY